MCNKTFKLSWYISVVIFLVTTGTFILYNKYDTDTCYDTLYDNINLYKLLTVSFILICIISIVQIIFLISECVFNRRVVYFLTNMIFIIIIGLLCGFFTNFIVSSSDNCLLDFKSTDMKIYYYFIVIFVIICINFILIVHNFFNFIN